MNGVSPSHDSMNRVCLSANQSQTDKRDNRKPNLLWRSTRNLSTIHLRTEFLLNFHRNCAVRQFLFPFLFDDVNSTISSKLITSFIVENFSSLTRETWKFHRYFGILRGGWDGKMINKFWKLWDLEIVWC